jgi:2-beta-glucuronyltransferase
LAEQFAAEHEVRFISIGYSDISKLRNDSRVSFDVDANKWRSVSGVQCYLWKTALHPFDFGSGRIRTIAGYLYDLWSCWPNEEVDRSARLSDLVIVVSGIGPALLRRIRRQAPDSIICYYSCDRLSVAKVHPRIQDILDRDQAIIDTVVVVSRAQLADFDRYSARVSFVPHGLDLAAFKSASQPRFARDKNAVSVGSMLFDINAVDIMAKNFPDVDFHLIGTGAQSSNLTNVHIYPEMAFAETIAFLQHVNVGIAAYQNISNGEYLSDSSIKLRQFGHLGLPSVCPYLAVGESSIRHGYDPSIEHSIVTAFRSALNVSERRSEPSKSWEETAQSFLKAAVC